MSFSKEEILGFSKTNLKLAVFAIPKDSETLFIIVNNQFDFFVKAGTKQVRVSTFKRLAY
jgi:hypothetical protein